MKTAKERRKESEACCVEINKLLENLWEDISWWWEKTFQYQIKKGEFHALISLYDDNHVRKNENFQELCLLKKVRSETIKLWEEYATEKFISLGYNVSPHNSIYVKVSW